MTYIWTLCVTVMVLSGYLIQRTMQFLENEDGFMGQYANQQSQFHSDIGLLNLEFSFATMNIAWIWLLAVLVITLALVVRRRSQLIDKMREFEELRELTSLLIPFDFFSSDVRWLSCKILWIPVALPLTVCFFQVFPVATHFVLAKRYIEAFFILTGVFYCIYATSKLYGEIYSSR